MIIRHSGVGIALACCLSGFVFLSHTNAQSGNYAGDYLWVPCYGSDSVYKVNVVSHEVERGIRVGNGPCGIAVGPKYVYVTHRFSPYLYRITKTDSAVDSVNLSSVMAFSIGVSVDQDSVALVVGRLHLTDSNYDMAKIARIDASGSITGTANLVNIDAEYSSSPDSAARHLGIAADGKGNVIIPWSRSYDLHTGIIRLNASSLEFTNTTFSPTTYGYRGAGAAFDSNGVGWTIGQRADKSYYVTWNPSIGVSYIHVPSGKLAGLYDLAIDYSGNVWSGNRSNELLKYNPTAGTLATYALPGSSRGMCIDRFGYLWIAFSDLNTLAKYDANGTQVGTPVSVGQTPLGMGDMTGYECYRYDSPSCCEGTTGNVNASEIVDLSDLSAMISYLTGTGYDLPCQPEANIDNVGIIDLSDLAGLISYLSGSGYVLPNCL